MYSFSLLSYWRATKKVVQFSRVEWVGVEEREHADVPTLSEQIKPSFQTFVFATFSCGQKGWDGKSKKQQTKPDELLKVWQEYLAFSAESKTWVSVLATEKCFYPWNKTTLWGNVRGWTLFWPRYVRLPVLKKEQRRLWRYIWSCASQFAETFDTSWVSCHAAGTDRACKGKEMQNKVLRSPGLLHKWNVSLCVPRHGWRAVKRFVGTKQNHEDVRSEFLDFHQSTKCTTVCCVGTNATHQPSNENHLLCVCSLRMTFDKVWWMNECVLISHTLKQRSTVIIRW